MIASFNEFITETSRRQKATQLFRDGKSKWKTFCIISPYNPMGDKALREDNHKYDELFKEYIRKNKIPNSPVHGKYSNNKEKSYILYAISLNDTLKLAKQFNQESFIYGKLEDGKFSFSYYEKDANGNYEHLEDIDKYDIVADINDNFTIIGKYFKFNIPWKMFEDICVDIDEMILERCDKYKQYADNFQYHLDKILSDKSTSHTKYVSRCMLFGEKYFIGHYPISEK